MSCAGCAISRPFRFPSFAVSGWMKLSTGVLYVAVQLVGPLIGGGLAALVYYLAFMWGREEE